MQRLALPSPHSLQRLERLDAARIEDARWDVIAPVDDHAGMEALVAASAAGLTIYDMCKAVDRGMQIDAVRLIEKRGGKSGTWRRPGEAWPWSVLCGV